MMKQLLCLLCGMGLWFAPLEAQSLRRSTLCSAGAVQTVDNVRLSSSTGQKSVSCSVVFNGNNYLRQGFQQPTPEQGEPCTHTAAFAFETLSDECGTSYNFEFTGTVDDLDQTTFEWNFGTDAAPATSTELNPTGVVYASTGPKTISLRVTVDGCETGVSQIVQVDETGFGALSEVTGIDCFGDANGSITLTPFGDTEGVTIEWSDGATDTLRTDLAAGDYTVSLTDGTGCTYEETITVTGPTEALSLNGATIQETCNDTNDGAIELVVNNAAPGALTYEWSDPSIGNTPLATGLSAGTYSVVIIDANGCRTDASFEVTLFCEDPDLPDTFTPNGDGINDTWVIPGIENFPNNEITLFNRWGQMVWDVTGYQNDWEGINNKGERLPFGAYFYVINFNDPNGTPRIGGSLTIVR